MNFNKKAEKPQYKSIFSGLDDMPPRPRPPRTDGTTPGGGGGASGQGGGASGGGAGTVGVGKDADKTSTQDKVR
jgi:hypothetical protein